MRHLISGFMSWMKHLTVAPAVSRAELKRWAQTEYGKDWIYAYNYMLNHNGRAPQNREFA